MYCKSFINSCLFMIVLRENVVVFFFLSISHEQRTSSFFCYRIDVGARHISYINYNTET